MTRRIALSLLLAASLAGALEAPAQTCLAPSSPSVCDPNWQPGLEFDPGQEATRVRVQSAGISIAAGRWHVVLNLTSFSHPGEVRIGIHRQEEITVWSATAGSPSALQLDLDLGPVTDTENLTIEWRQADGEIRHRTLYLRTAGMNGKTSPWWAWSTGRGSVWPPEPSPPLWP